MATRIEALDENGNVVPLRWGSEGNDQPFLVIRQASKSIDLVRTAGGQPVDREIVVIDRHDVLEHHIVTFDQAVARVEPRTLGHPDDTICSVLLQPGQAVTIRMRNDVPDIQATQASIVAYRITRLNGQGAA